MTDSQDPAPDTALPLRTGALLLDMDGTLIDSGPAVERSWNTLLRELGTDLSRAAAIGDSENDLEMLRAVALPIAMGNASDAVKAVCKRETLTNAEDGVAAAIGRILDGNA